MRPTYFQAKPAHDETSVFSRRTRRHVDHHRCSSRPYVSLFHILRSLPCPSRSKPFSGVSNFLRLRFSAPKLPSVTISSWRVRCSQASWRTIQRGTRIIRSLPMVHQPTLRTLFILMVLFNMSSCGCLQRGGWPSAPHATYLRYAVGDISRPGS